MTLLHVSSGVILRDFYVRTCHLSCGFPWKTKALAPIRFIFTFCTWWIYCCCRKKKENREGNYYKVKWIVTVKLENDSQKLCSYFTFASFLLFSLYNSFMWHKDGYQHFSDWKLELILETTRTRNSHTERHTPHIYGDWWQLCYQLFLRLTFLSLAMH